MEVGRLLYRRNIQYRVQTGVALQPLLVPLDGKPLNVKMMKALVKAQSAPGLSLQEVPVPGIGINDVLIRVDRTGICGTGTR